MFGFSHTHRSAPQLSYRETSIYNQLFTLEKYWQTFVLGNHLFFMACGKCVTIHRNAEIDNTEVNCKCPYHLSNTISDYD